MASNAATRCGAIIAPILLALIASPFAYYSADLGVAGLAGGGDGWFRFHEDGAATSTNSVFLHMVAGGIITLLAPLQMIGAVRRIQMFPATLAWPKGFWVA